MIQYDENGIPLAIAQVEVPGTPEEVWEAIATGPGVSSWFVPCDMDAEVGGKIRCQWGGGISSESEITGWEPPHRFTAKSGEHEYSPSMGTEWVVEAQEGGTCLVRVVHRFFTQPDGWERQIESTQEGWRGFFMVLNLRQKHFKHVPSGIVIEGVVAKASSEETWAKFLANAGISSLAVGTPVALEGDSPSLTGEIVAVGPDHHPDEVLVLGEHVIGQFFVMPMGEGSYLSGRVFYYGEDGPSRAQAESPKWAAWLGALA